MDEWELYELDKFCKIITINFLKKEIQKEEKLLNNLISKEQTFTKNAKITQNNAKIQNRIVLSSQQIKKYKTYLSDLLSIN